MRIDNNGNVGIGVLSPTQKLDIAGSARLRSVESSTNTSDITLVVDNNGVIKKKRSEVEGTFRSYLFEDRYYNGDSNTTIYRLDRHIQVSDPGNNFNHETGIFVAPATGLYRISMTITIETQSGHSVENVVVGLATNGNWVIRFSIPKDNIMTPGENIGTAFTFTGVGRLTQGTSYYFGTTGQTRFIANPSGNSGQGIGSYFEVERIQ